MKRIIFICLSICFLTSLEATYVLTDGKLIEKSEVATLSVQEHFSAAQIAYENKKWDECMRHANIIQKNFDSSPFYQEATFYLAVSYFHQKEYDFANKNLSEYLKKEAPSKHFEEAIFYKFKIAEHYREGAKKHLFGGKSLPKWMPAKEDAVTIYDEVIAALPNHDLGAQALYGKAQLLFAEDQYQESIEAAHTLIRRFPKHPLASESYLFIGKVYLKRCKSEYADPDFLDLARINLKKFSLDFPTEPRSEEVKQMILSMEEVFAENLFETGDFFERTKKPNAAIIYYNKIVTKYPDTKTAHTCEKRLVHLNSKKNKEKPKAVESEIVKKEEEPSQVQETPVQNEN